MYIDKYLSANNLSAADVLALGSGAKASRRTFIKTSFGGVAGIAIAPTLSLAQDKKPDVKPGQKPTEQPAAFVSIAKDGTTTILCNRMDMGQGIETALAMICAEELEADWSKVKTGFGNEKPNYVDPGFGMHLTGGSNSVKNSYMQYRELGARTKAMLVTAAAKQWKVDAATLKAENGVVTGAGKRAGYGELFDAAMKEPIPEQVVLKDAKNFKLIGKPTGLKVAQAKSTGAQQYGIDVKLPGMLTAMIVDPPVFGAKFKTFDASVAEKVNGVRAVLPVDLDRGGKGIAIVADGYWPAKMGRDALKVEWDTSGVAKADTAVMEKQFRELAKTKGRQVPDDKLKADTSKLAAAPNKLTAEFVFPYLNHAQMEPLACTVDLKADSCNVYTASQMPGVDAGALAKSTGLKPDQIRIHVQMAGGGFGRRAVPSSEYVVDAASVAKALAAAGKPAPVKVVWSREDDMKAGYYRPFTVHRAEIGFDAQGNIAGWEHVIVSQSILKGSAFEAFAVKDGVDSTAHEGMRNDYTIPLNVTVHHPEINVPVLWWRSVGSTHTAFVMETLIDEIAEATKQDPVAYRMKLLSDKHPRRRAALQLAVDKSGYGRKQLAAGMHWGVAVHESFQTVVAYVVEAGVKDGKLIIANVTAGVHCNLCVNPRTVETQVQGSAMMAITTMMPDNAITFKDGEVQQSNFHQYPVARITDAPPIAVHIAPSSDPPKGVGEPGLPPLAPAVANALRRATGKPLREMPFKLA
jgi:isoquinoline 1-oxidoreductase subunit beta